jgi:hypothetical protein
MPAAAIGGAELAAQPAMAKAASETQTGSFMSVFIPSDDRV